MIIIKYLNRLIISLRLYEENNLIVSVAHSRRGDLETLGYNLIQWLCGRLPWEKKDGGMSVTTSAEAVQEQKELSLSDVPLFMRECFPSEQDPPGKTILLQSLFLSSIHFSTSNKLISLCLFIFFLSFLSFILVIESLTMYMQYVAQLGFETRPDYHFLRSLFWRSAWKNDNFFVTPNLSMPLRKSCKRTPNENLSDSMPVKRLCIRNSARKPCVPVNCEVRIDLFVFFIFFLCQLKFEKKKKQTNFISFQTNHFFSFYSLDAYDEKKPSNKSENSVQLGGNIGKTS